MAGIYLHIPFCRQACHYCNFHFTTSLRRKNELTAALLKEIDIRRDYLGGEPIETIYFGGGTPSLLHPDELRSILDKIYQTHTVSGEAEITLESNPDDIEIETLEAWRRLGINRLSIGIQSFFDEDLRWMNRAHNGDQAVKALEWVMRYFPNTTADLIYGTPYLTDEKWKHNLDQLLAFGVPHISSYALTVEPQTLLYKKIEKGLSPDVDPDRQARQFLLLMERMEAEGFEHYEISNFAKPGFRSRHNSSYWDGKKYLGLGPSAHSFDGTSRQWNIANNSRYLNGLAFDELVFEKEILTPVQRLNEYIMTSLRTLEGIDLERIPVDYRDHLRTLSEKFIADETMRQHGSRLILTKKGKLFADGIASDLFRDQ
ncbi:MAG: radical SAM family heme chaperone HemW [Chitinophagaceae bacterium]|nr:radical SAM family heme chaperone HemW [Chitinophagaceae bacterium]